MLIRHCIECHGPNRQRGDLRLDSGAYLAQGGASGEPTVVAKHPEKSYLLKAVRHVQGVQAMPPKKRLKDAEIADLTRWIERGAVYPARTQNPAAAGPTHWAFQPVVEPTLPANRRHDWGSSPIDRFILAELEARGLRPAPPADRRTLIRRATFDLTGLPPTPAEVEAFVQDTSPNAFATVVDRLLASPHYGERWGRHWLDLARYADSNGMDENLVYANAWRYRDYVIRAFNEDMPYDRFIREQIAGDLLPAVNGSPPPLIATGFLVIGPKMLAEDDPVKMEMDIIDEQIETIGRAFLGMTLGCARCHDHKNDPVSTADYYSLAGIFKSTRTMDHFKVVARWHERPIATREQEDRLRASQDRLAQLKKRIDEIDREAREKLLAAEQARAELYRDVAMTWLKERPASAVVAMASPTGPPAGTVLREAEDYDRGNVLKSYDGYGAKIGVIYNRGELPNVAEYDVHIGEPAAYRLEIRVAAAESRPVKVRVNGKPAVAEAAGLVTGSWYPDTQTWVAAGVLPLARGKNVIRLERAGPFPHIDKVALVPLPAGPAGGAATLEERAAKAHVVPQILRRWVELLETRKAPLAPADLDRLKTDPKGPFANFAGIEAHYSLATRKTLDGLRQETARAEKAMPMLPETMAVAEGTATNLKINLRGNHLTLGKEVRRGFPKSIGPASALPPDARQSGRLELADWIARPDHPLTSRVMVNRLWHWHFGAGLVRTPDNFGLLGERPTHPQLLDWLAVQFVKSGWSIKAMHRLIMLSSTYQTSVVEDPEAARADPDNRHCSHMNRRRLEAEAIRDSLLAVSGTLDPTMGGSLLEGKNRAYVPGYPNGNYEKYDFPRRSVYLPVLRSMLYDVFQAFDFADPSVGNGERASTTVASQALFMMNSKLVKESARRLAERILAVPAASEPARIQAAYALLYARPPTDRELQHVLAALGRMEQALHDRPDADRRLQSWTSVCRVLMSANEFVYLD